MYFDKKITHVCPQDNESNMLQMTAWVWTGKSRYLNQKSPDTHKLFHAKILNSLRKFLTLKVNFLWPHAECSLQGSPSGGNVGPVLTGIKATGMM